MNVKGRIRHPKVRRRAIESRMAEGYHTYNAGFKNLTISHIIKIILRIL